MFAIDKTHNEIRLIWNCGFGCSYLSKFSVLITKNPVEILNFGVFLTFLFFITEKTVSPITTAVPPIGGTMEELRVTNGVNF